MKKYRNQLLLAVFFCILVLVFYFFFIYVSPLPVAVIDQNGSGFVSVSELLNARDIGAREIIGKQGCTEYYWLKDGLPAYEKCTNNVTFAP